MDFFFDKWWEVEDNNFFDPGTCFLLNTKDDTLRVHYPDDAPEKGHIEGEWVIEDDHIFLEDIYGFDISIWLFGQCGDYSVIVSTSVLDEGAVIDRREDYPELQLKVDYPEETASLTKESLDRIIREEVEAHYRNRK